MRSRALYLILVAMAVCCVIAGDANAKPRRRSALPSLEWSLDATLGVNYNDNLIGLSERDRNRFKLDATAFPTPLETVDDLESELTIHPGMKWRAPKSLMFTGDYRVKLVKRWRNEFADYSTHNVGISVRPRKAESRWSARFRVLVIPSYYLRVYRDRDYNEYHATRYSNLDYEGSFRYRVSRPLWVEVRSSFGSFYYNRKFTEYDSEFRDVSGAAGYDFGKVRVSGGYTRRTSDNIGKSQLSDIAFVDPDLQDTEYGDADYDEDEFAAGVVYPVVFKGWKPTEFMLDYRLRRRVYTTNRSLESDPFHRGRLDRRGQFTTTLSSDLSRRAELALFLTYDARESDSDSEGVALAKDFVRREYGLRLTYSIR